MPDLNKLKVVQALREALPNTMQVHQLVTHTQLDEWQIEGILDKLAAQGDVMECRAGRWLLLE